MTRIENIQILTKKIVGLTLILSATSFAFAQEKTNISGTVIDQDKQSVPYASLSFNSKTSKLNSDAVLTDEKGNFQLQLVPGNYEITIEAIDYKKANFSQQIVGGRLNNLILEKEKNVTNNRTKEIEGVTLTAKSSAPYKIELDKKVYNVDQDLTAKGGNLQDVLQNVPSVNVDSDGSVSMRGNANVRFLINGKPSSILGITDDSNALRNIPADQIEKIEVITNPSSKYEASGTAGILNIILKKTKGLGFNGSVEGSVGYLPQSRLNTNLSWNLGKLSWFVNGGGGFGRFENTNNLFINDFSKNEINNSDTKTKSDFKNYNVNAGLNYNFTEKTSANFSVNTNISNNENNSLTNITSNISQNTRRISTGESENNNIQFDAGFEHKIGSSGQIISGSGSYQNSKNNSFDFADDTSFILSQQFQNNNNNNKQKTWIAKIDYELPIGKNSKLEAGARFDDKNNITSNRRFDNYVNTPVDNLFFYNDIDYTERISSIYAQFKSKIDKFSYQIGLRNENTNLSTIYNGFEYQKDTNTFIPIVNLTNNRNYSGIFPSVFLGYNVTESSQFSLNYSKRINRPRSFQLIPSYRFLNGNNFFIGNPNLNPSYVNSFELGYNYSKGSKLTINPTLYYQRTNDDINMTISNVDGNFITTPANLGTEDRYGMDFNYNITATKWLRLFGNINLFGYKNDSEYNNIKTSQSGFASQARLTAAIKLDKSTNMQFSGNYNGPQKTFQNERLAMYVANFGFSKNLLENQATLNFNVQDIFNSRRRQVKTTSATFYREMDMQMMPRTFMLSFSYRFKNKFAEDKKQKPKKQDQRESGGMDDGPM